MISAGERIAYYRCPANLVLWSPNPDCRGKFAGKLETVQLKVCACRQCIISTTTHHSSTAAAALATCAATHSLQVGEFGLSCTVWFGAGLSCWRLSAGWRLWTEISAIHWATCLLCATSEQHVRRSILRGGWAACIEWAAVQSTWYCTIVDCLQCTAENPFIFHLVRATVHLWHLWFLCAAYKCTYLLTYLLLTVRITHSRYSLSQTWYKCATKMTVYDSEICVAHKYNFSHRSWAGGIRKFYHHWRNQTSFNGRLRVLDVHLDPTVSRTIVCLSNTFYFNGHWNQAWKGPMTESNIVQAIF